MKQMFALSLLVLSTLTMGCNVGMDPFSPTLGGGYATLQPSSSLRFDVTPVSGVYTEADLSVIPTGEAPVEIIDVWVEGPDSDSFHVEEIALPILIAPNQEAILTVGFSTVRTGTHGGTVFVLLGDVDGDALSVRVEGMGCRDNNMDRQCDPN
jgi:hypothetical protein